ELDRCIIKGRGNPFLARRVELSHSFPRRSCDRRPPSRSSLPFIESKVFSEKTGRRLVLTSHRCNSTGLLTRPLKQESPATRQQGSVQSVITLEIARRSRAADTRAI